FAAPSEAQAAALVTDEGLARAVEDLRRRLASPLSTLVTKTAPDDPFLSIPRLFERLQQGRTDALATVEGRFVAQERFAVLLIGTEASAFDATAQRRVQQGLDAAAARVPPAWRGRRAYFEVDGGPHAAGAASFVGQTLARIGIGNIVPAGLGPFPALNPEFVLRAQPELVIARHDEVEAMPRRPGWSALAALRDGRACGFERATYDLLTRPGPRLGEAAARIADCIAALPEPGARGRGEAQGAR
ncbi:MAG: hypothetical protein KDF63_15370, partial [Rhodoferax sp.]|nr:hypothetical protein [Rhodoferax sp.]